MKLPCPYRDCRSEIELGNAFDWLQGRTKPICKDCDRYSELVIEDTGNMETAFTLIPIPIRVSIVEGSLVMNVSLEEDCRAEDNSPETPQSTRYDGPRC